MGKWALVGLALTTACGGTSTDFQDGSVAAQSDATKSDMGVWFGGDAAADVFVVTVPCSASPPAEGAPCTQFGERCEYGSSFWSTCDSILFCDPQSQTWILQPQDPLLCSGTTQGCPAQFSDAQGVCSSVGADCQYPEGYCDCRDYCGGPPPPGSTQPGWTCVPAKQGCPSPRPHLGTSCTQEGQQCDYMICCSGTRMLCQNGVWQGNRLSVPCE